MVQHTGVCCWQQRLYSVSVAKSTHYLRNRCFLFSNNSVIVSCQDKAYVHCGLEHFENWAAGRWRFGGKRLFVVYLRIFIARKVFLLQCSCKTNFRIRSCVYLMQMCGCNQFISKKELDRSRIKDMIFLIDIIFLSSCFQWGTKPLCSRIRVSHRCFKYSNQASPPHGNHGSRRDEIGGCEPPDQRG